MKHARFPCVVRAFCPLNLFALSLAAVTTKLLFVDINCPPRTGQLTVASAGSAFGFSCWPLLCSSLRQPSSSDAALSPPCLFPSFPLSPPASSRLVSSRLVLADDARKSYSFRRGTCGGFLRAESCRRKRAHFITSASKYFALSTSRKFRAYYRTRGCVLY